MIDPWVVLRTEQDVDRFMAFVHAEALRQLSDHGSADGSICLDIAKMQYGATTKAVLRDALSAADRSREAGQAWAAGPNEGRSA